ncbi:MAG: hypothetical protein OEW75_11460 [Cyclobacteriaceae bacterium]|nr:hypothetical protein [Cyclobacteriaceae bacterium]
MIITKKNDSIRYELFNHWYSRSYSLLRDISVSVAQLPIQSDSVGIHDMGNKFLVKDKKNGLDKMAMGGLNRSCYSINFMRNMSFAYSLSLKYKIGHHAFYDEIDWEQSQDAFQNLYMELVNDSLHIPASPPN